MTFDLEQFDRMIQETGAEYAGTGIPWGAYVCPDCGMLQVRVWPWPDSNPCNNCPGTLVPFTPPASERRG